MTSYLNDDGLGGRDITAITFAERHGLSKSKVIRLCKLGRIFGARKHVKTKQWWIYPPAKILPSLLQR